MKIYNLATDNGLYTSITVQDNEAFNIPYGWYVNSIQDTETNTVTNEVSINNSTASNIGSIGNYGKYHAYNSANRYFTNTNFYSANDPDEAKFPPTLGLYQQIKNTQEIKDTESEILKRKEESQRFHDALIGNYKYNYNPGTKLSGYSIWGSYEQVHKPKVEEVKKEEEAEISPHWLKDVANAFASLKEKYKLENKEDMPTKKQEKVSRRDVFKKNIDRTINSGYGLDHYSAEIGGKPKKQVFRGLGLPNSNIETESGFMMGIDNLKKGKRQGKENPIKTSYIGLDSYNPNELKDNVKIKYNPIMDGPLQGELDDEDEEVIPGEFGVEFKTTTDIREVIKVHDTMTWE